LVFPEFWENVIPVSEEFNTDFRVNKKIRPTLPESC